ncbi:MAG TPA: alpha/beta hydrolase [Vicinamibacterales bacterium]|nr:alpha/beta hydrolase [Vicinamibacterales bacterium]
MIPTALAIALLLAVSAQDAQMGPNGEIDGLTAKFVDVNGVRTRYYDYGQGEVIVLVHGGMITGASTANNFSLNLPGLAKRFRVIAVDRLAQGMTDNPKDDAGFTNEGTANHVYQFIQTLKLGPVHLVGHSAGGGTAFYVAAEHPEIVKTLTVISAGPQMPPAGDGPTKFDALLAKCPPDRTSYEHLKCRLLALGHTPKTFPPYYEKADDFMGNLPKSRDGRKRMAATRTARPGWPDRENEAYRQRAWEKARAGGLQMPILIFSGKQDTLSWDANDPHAMMRRELGFFDLVGAKNPRVKLIVINEAGHFPYREHPGQFNADLMQFIELAGRGKS